MTQERTKRKLTAILSADVKGYSRLMGEDEVATIRTLTTYQEVMNRTEAGWWTLLGTTSWLSFQAWWML
jgi:class 3 adenylate cyclase